ncbi:MAG: DUF5596 domain-containing protein [Clostridiales bacterium]|nr:DUF5596 domain-containing protein [Clostridiales bacterium]
MKNRVKSGLTTCFGHDTLIYDMTAKKICKKINAPHELLQYVGNELAPVSVLQALTDIDTAPEGYAKLKGILGDDKDGLKMFSCMMDAATLTYEKYRGLGIDEKIFTDTMSCFTRFAGEHLASYGKYGFDRGWWTYRQLSCVLFKIGELEYEYRDDEKTVHLHIPTGADIRIPQCKNSIDDFKQFTAGYFPTKNYPIVCRSWLLSPALKELLPQHSKIIEFQRCFEITDWDKTQNDFLQWVFGKSYMDFSELPENTSLQKNMKKYLLNGGVVGSALGRLIDFDRL